METNVYHILTHLNSPSPGKRGESTGSALGLSPEWDTPPLPPGAGLGPGRDLKTSNGELMPAFLPLQATSYFCVESGWGWSEQTEKKEIHHWSPSPKLPLK